MTDEEYRQEQEERARLEREINRTINAINRLRRENAELEVELDHAISSLNRVVSNAREMGSAVTRRVRGLSGEVSEAEVETIHVFQALNELITQYTTFKRLSTATKNLTQLNDEYYTKFSFYNELRRISLGCVIGLDSNLISGETTRKKVEKVYLQNTDYWLAYAAMAVMLWASNESEAAKRAMEKSLNVHYFNSCLFYLLINLRFNRIDAAKKWYVQYLDKADMNNLGDEWQYLLQAYLFGAFGSDEGFQDTVAQCFQKMMAQVEVSTVGFAKQFSLKAIEFAELYPHRTERTFTTLGRTCSDYAQMLGLLSTAEKNSRIADVYNELADAEEQDARNLPERIENVLYTLVNDYDDEEWEIVRNIRLNEAIISSMGDEDAAQATSDALYADQQKRKNLGDLLLSWAFADKSTQADISVQRFSISMMKEAIIKGFTQFAENYRKKEQDKYRFCIDGCEMRCGEQDLAEGEALLDAHYDKNKVRDMMNDKQVLIYAGMCGGAVLLLVALLAFFSPVLLTLGVLLGAAGGFLLWQRIQALQKHLAEKKRKAKLLLAQALDELAQWRSAYADADARNDEIRDALERY